MCYDPKTKQQSSQWKRPDEPRPKKARQSRSHLKSMLIFFSIMRVLCTTNLLHEVRRSTKNITSCCRGVDVESGGKGRGAREELSKIILKYYRSYLVTYVCDLRVSLVTKILLQCIAENVSVL